MELFNYQDDRFEHFLSHKLLTMEELAREMVCSHVVHMAIVKLIMNVELNSYVLDMIREGTGTCWLGSCTMTNSRRHKWLETKIS